MAPLPTEQQLNTLSILVPVYDERDTILSVLDALGNLHLPIPAEIVVVDDGSADGTRRLLLDLDGQPATFPTRVYFHQRNRGKGAAVQTALEHARGDVIVVQDADLELDPRDIARLLEPILARRTEVCFGSRFLRPNPALRRLPAYWANRLLNALSNRINGIHITDFNTCYKMITARIAARLALTSRGFAMEAEITAKLARMGLEIHERPIDYRPRTREQGKKIRPTDLAAYLWAMLRFRFAAIIDQPPAPFATTDTLSPVAVTSPRPREDWPVLEEFQEAWDTLWAPPRRQAPALPKEIPVASIAE